MRIIIYLIASIMGMKAISTLSVIAFTLFGLLLIFIFFGSGSASFILTSSFRSFGNLIVHFIPMSAIIENGHFTQNWTVYYWAYWMVWCVATPFFIGSISKGRTIRNVIFGGYFWGLLGTYLSFFILTNFGISRQINGVVNATSMINQGRSYAGVIVALMKTLQNYQLGLILLILAMIGLYSTVFDSITMVISKYSYKSLKIDEEPSKLMRGFWAIVFVLLPLSLLLTGTSFSNIQSVAIIVAFPTGIVMLLIVASFYWEIGLNKYRKYIPICIISIALVINFIFFIISFFKENNKNFGDSATWFGSFITVGTLVVAYWQLLITKKENEPDIIVAEGTKKLYLDFEKEKDSKLQVKFDTLNFQIANIGKSAAKDIQIDIANKKEFIKSLQNLPVKDLDIHNNLIYIGLYNTKEHLETVDTFSISVKNYVDKSDDTEIYVPTFYVYLLRNYVYDEFKVIKKKIPISKKQSKEYRDAELFKVVKKFPILQYEIKYRNNDENLGKKQFVIKPFATLYNFDDNPKGIYFEFVIENKK